MSESAALEAALNLIEAASDSQGLIAGIDAALAVKAPAGEPVTISTQANTYHHVAQLCQQVEDDELKVKTKSLPASWRGQAAESADWALSGLGMQADRAQQAFAAASKALATWSDQLRAAQRQDAHGLDQLAKAITQLSQPDGLFNIFFVNPFIREVAASGCHARWTAANLAASAADDASAALRPWPDQARAQQIRVPGVDALTGVSLAYNFGGLTPTAEMLASKHLDAMSAADRSAFEKLVAHASSVGEAHYLWEAAGAGYSLGQLKSFDAVIHPHGNNAEWLQQHLDPGIVSPEITEFFSGSSRVPISFDNSGVLTFTQGQDPTCVSASTVMARLGADPVLMLGVTTGQGPAAVSATGVKAGDDSQAAITARAQTLFNQYYAEGRAVDDPKFLGIPIPQALLPDGIDPAKGGIALDNQLLTPVTGSTYEYQPLNDMADRQAALPKIEAALEAGKPVPLSVEPSSEGTGHEMIIEEYQAQNNALKIYNPWGYTQWVDHKPVRRWTTGGRDRAAVWAAGGLAGPERRLAAATMNPATPTGIVQTFIYILRTSEIWMASVASFHPGRDSETTNPSVNGRGVQHRSSDHRARAWSTIPSLAYAVCAPQSPPSEQIGSPAAHNSVVLGR